MDEVRGQLRSHYQRTDGQYERDQAGVIMPLSQPFGTDILLIHQNAQELSLHPYFDNLGNDRWHVVEVQPSAPPETSFGLRPPATWSEGLTARVNPSLHNDGAGRTHYMQRRQPTNSPISPTRCPRLETRQDLMVRPSILSGS